MGIADPARGERDAELVAAGSARSLTRRAQPGGAVSGSAAFPAALSAPFGGATKG